MTTITRKELASILGISIKTIERKEKEWKLDKCRVNRSLKPILYSKDKVDKLDL